jgi:cytochrome b561
MCRSVGPSFETPASRAPQDELRDSLRPFGRGRAVRTADTGNGYGWISIALHWLTAVIVITMFVIGTMSQSADEADYVRLVHLHTTIGIAAYPLLWGRIGWRFAVGHPGRLPKQSAFFFAIGKYFHFAMLLAIAVMLLSGPLMVWTAGERIHVFGLAIPGPFGKLEAVQHALRTVHGTTAWFILGAMILHVLAVFKHTVLDRDGTFDKIMIAAGGRRDRLTAAQSNKV